MARTQKRKVGSRNYKTAYTENSLTSAIHAVNSSSMSIRKASKEFKIPFGTLRNKIKGLHSGKVGRPFRLSTECEVQILETIDCLATWRVPLTAQSLCHMVKGYLDSRGVVDSVFTNNLPGKDWLDQFVRRHGLTKRLADNVKTSRAEITASTISSYFDRLEQTAESIPTQNCFNYDETNITDDPGSKKIIVRRGMRRVERKVEHSKQSITIMFCGSASGVHLPPMVVYRAKNLYTNWTVGGPAGAVYDVTKSGWFDSRTFETWFVQLFLPSVSHLHGKKLLLGDNLPSHFSTLVIEESIKNDIVFVTMPANSTHLCQPLDVAVFGPVKRSWRKILDSWRKESRVKGTIPKSIFPSLLKRLYDSLQTSNLVSGFQACGIYPLDRSQVLKRLPSSSRDPGGDGTSSALNSSVMSLLETHCGLGQSRSEEDNNTSRRRGRKILTEPGARIVPATTTEITQNASTSASVTGTDEIWNCSLCSETWERDGDDRWILCDNCNRQYHLQCSGIDYPVHNYYSLDIEGMSFKCRKCS